MKKKFSLIKLLIGFCYVFVAVFIIATLCTGAGLATTLSVTKVYDGWVKILNDNDAMEVTRLISYVILLLTIPFSQAGVEDESVAKFKKFMTFNSPWNSNHY